MRVISTIISMFAAWLMIATPVMACCVTGHMDQSINSALTKVSSLPPCHQGQVLNSQAANPDQVPEKFCPSCDDCAFSPSTHGENVSATTAATDFEFTSLTQTSVNIPPADLGLPDSTAPAGRQSLPIDKPLFATDSLLI